MLSFWWQWDLDRIVAGAQGTSLSGTPVVRSVEPLGVPIETWAATANCSVS